MRPFDDFLDLTGKNRNLKCFYHGNNYVHLEGRILSETKSELEVGVSLHKVEIESHKYDSSKKSLEIYYKPYEGFVAGLNFEGFKVPKDIKEINVYDSQFC